ncbi:MAG: hypothetical protein FWF72_03710 [Paludibacter sp.]|nr:hypothetical protein [Paludibacter sp.]
MEKIGLLVAYFFVAVVAVVILLFLFKLGRSYFRYRKRMRNEKMKGRENAVEDTKEE